MSFVIIIVIGMFVGRVIGGLFWWSVYRQQPLASSQSAQSEQKPPLLPSISSPLDLNLPLVVEIVVDIHKQFHIENKGKVPITDIVATKTEYLFNKKAWDEKRLK